MSKQTIPAKVPWYELDRMIIESFERDEWDWTINIVNKVRVQCIERKWPMKEAEIVSRLVELVKMESLAVSGDIWHRPIRSVVCLMIAA